MRLGKRFKGSNLGRVLVGMKKEIVWPFLANLLERWRNGVRWPRANQGYMAMCREVWWEVAAAASAIVVRDWRFRVKDEAFLEENVHQII